MKAIVSDPVAFSGSLLGGSGKEPFDHSRARALSAIVKSAKPTIQWKYAVATIVSLKVFVVKKLKEISGFHAHTFNEHDTFKP